MTYHRPAAPAFTLLELLVVISIIVLLIAILLPAMGKARVTSKRIKEASDTRQALFVLIQYADEHDGDLPQGQPPAQVNSYGMIQTNRDAWKPLNSDYGMPDNKDPSEFGCSSWQFNNPSNSHFYKTNNTGWHVPWVYWGNRPDAPAPGTTTSANATPSTTYDPHAYDFMQKLHEAGTATSDTLLTCHGRRGIHANSLIPHLAERNDVGLNTPVWTNPETLLIGKADGSANFLPFSTLRHFQKGTTTNEFFYAPN